MVCYLHTLIANFVDASFIFSLLAAMTSTFSTKMIIAINFFTDIESKLRRIEEDPEGTGTTHLQKCIQGVNSLATRAFEPLFERQVCKEFISRSI